MKDLTVLLSNTRGQVALALGAIAQAGVKVEAGCLFPRAEGRVLHVAVEDDALEAATAALEAAGRPAVDVRDVVTVPFEDRVGQLAEIAEKVAEAGATAYTAYIGTGNRLVLAATDLDATRRALGI
jgi:hypothetical protein